jgi:membrane-bound lytic murein transglycosylase MltF
VAAVTTAALLAAACGEPKESAAPGPASPPGPDSQPPAPESTAILELGDPELAPFTGDLDAISKRRVLRALVAPSQTDFFLDHGAIKGIQAEMLGELEKFLNADRPRSAGRIRVKYVPVAFRDLLPALESGKGDLVAAFLTQTPERAQRADFVAALRGGVSEVVVTHKDVPAPADAADLAGREVHALRDSSYVVHLESLSSGLRAAGSEPIQIVQADPRLESEDLLQLVNSGLLGITVVDDYKAKLWARVLPDIRVHHGATVADGRKVGWAIRKDSPLLAEALARFTKRMRAGTLLGNLLFERYFADPRWAHDPTARAERDKLRRYIELFEKYGAEYGFEPLALAAQAYQESRLDHSLRSPRGAVGLMQLLPSTARDPNVGIPDIHDVENNVHAGTRYLAFLRDRYFSSPEIGAWNRAALSLAAYNAGPRKIQQARRDAARMGLDPNVWFDNVEFAVGKRVGREPVRYVANIYKYYVAYRLLHGRTQERSRAVGG